MNSPTSLVDPDGLQGSGCTVEVGVCGGGAGGGVSGGISFGFGGGGGGVSPTRSGVRLPSPSNVWQGNGVTISAERLPMGGPLDVPIGAAKQGLSDIVQLLSRVVNGDTP